LFPPCSHQNPSSSSLLTCFVVKFVSKKSLSSEAWFCD
jgi:hypothetical protein